MRTFIVALVFVALLSTVSIAQIQGEPAKPSSAEPVGPGGCQGAEECRRYCADNEEECKRFFEGSGSGPIMADAPERASISGPGGCSSPEECRLYCSKQENYETCKEFGAQRGAQAVQYGERSHFADIAPEAMIMGRIFSKADINPHTFVQYCPDTEAMVDAAIAELKSQGVWDIEAACDDLETEAGKCEEASGNCGELLKYPAFTTKEPDGTETSVTCDELSVDRLEEICVARNDKYLSSVSSADQCEQHWNNIQAQNSGACAEHNALVCGEDEFRANIRSEHEAKCKASQQEFGWTEDSYNACINGQNVDDAWRVQQARCDSMKTLCDHDTFISQCQERVAEGLTRASEQSSVHCEREATELYANIVQSCSQRQFHYDQCVARSSQACTFMDKAVEACASATEESVRAAMIEQASRFCGFKDAKENRVELHGKDVSTLVAALQSARDEAPEAYKPLIEQETDSIVETAETVEDIENKGLGYKLRWFIGAAAENEKRESAMLKQSADDLRDTIATLRLAINEIENESLRTVIEQEIEELEDEADSLEELSEEKENRARGMFSFLG